MLRTGNAWLDGLALIAPLGSQLACFRLRPLVFGAAATAGVLAAGATLWTMRPPALPEAAVHVAQSADANVFTDWRWAAELQHHLDHPVLASGGLASESAEFWLDYVRITQDYERWPDELRNLNVDLLVLPAEDAALLDQVRASADWQVLYDQDSVVVARRGSA
jgi:hypothetical protein